MSAAQPLPASRRSSQDRDAEAAMACGGAAISSGPAGGTESLRLFAVGFDTDLLHYQKKKASPLESARPGRICCRLKLEAGDQLSLSWEQHGRRRVGVDVAETAGDLGRAGIPRNRPARGAQLGRRGRLARPLPVSRVGNAGAVEDVGELRPNVQLGSFLDAEGAAERDALGGAALV